MLGAVGLCSRPASRTWEHTYAVCCSLITCHIVRLSARPRKNMPSVVRLLSPFPLELCCLLDTGFEPRAFHGVGPRWTMPRSNCIIMECTQTNMLEMRSFAHWPDQLDDPRKELRPGTWHWL